MKRLTPRYFFSGMMFGSKILGISFISIGCGIDFWFTKNIAGRLMVGLLWEREILPNGEESFKYECNADEQKNNQVDTFFFWWSQYISAGFWVVLAVLQIISFSFSKLFITALPATLTGFNLYAYYKCSGGKIL